MVRPIVTGINIGTQIPLIERTGPHWRIWTAYDDSFQKGEFLRLMGDGQIWRYEVEDGNISKPVIIKPKDPK